MKNYHEQEEEFDEIEFLESKNDWKILLFMFAVSALSLLGIATILNYIF